MDRNDVVFSKSTGHFTSPRGHTVLILVGSHWHKDDEMVGAFPNNFSEDPAVGLSYSLMPIGKPAIHQEPQAAEPKAELSSDSPVVDQRKTVRSGLPPVPKKGQA